MGLATSEAPKGSGLKTAIDILIAPKDAFEALRVVPTWGWVLIAALVLMVVGYFQQQPAVEHASLGTLTHAFATNLRGCGLNVAMMRITAGVKNALSRAFPVFILIAGAALQAAASGFYGG